MFLLSTKKSRWAFLAVFLFLSFLLIQAAGIAHAQSTRTPTPQPMTQAQIQQIPGWENWKDCNNTPPGTKCSDPMGGGLEGAELTQFLVPSNQFTITDNVVGPAVKAVEAPAKQFANWIAKKVLEAVIGVLYIIAAFCTLLAEWAGKILDLTLTPSLYNFTNNNLIVEGWKLVRDVCNMFFLLILLFIAFCTILQIPKYHAKKTLLTLILMALLINFSKPIAIFIFDGAQLAMNLFLKQIDTVVSSGGESAASKYMASSKIADSIFKNLPENKGTVEIAVHYIFTIVFLFMLAVALITIAVFFLIRLVAVMLLIIVSPLAFLATAVPDFQKLSSSWWSALFSYSYYGPAAAFFLLLATKLEKMNFPKLTDGMAGQNMTALINNSLHYLTTLVFLYAAIIMGKQFGLHAADAIVSRGNKAINWGARNLTGYSLAARGGRGIANIYKRHKSAATEAGKEALKQKYPRAHRWLTKEGADAAAQKFWGEKVFKTKDPHRQQQENVAKHEKDMKDKNFTEADYQKELKSADATRRMAAAMALVKMGKLDFKQYKEALSDFEKNPAFQKLFDNEVKKKSIHVAIDAEIESETKRLGRSLNTTESQAIYDKHLSTIKPSDIADQNVGELMNRREFVEFANDNYSTMSPGVKSDLAKKLSANDLWKFQGMGWV